MAENVATYTINIDSNADDAATSASDALRQLKRAIDADTKAIGQLNAAMRNLKAAGKQGGAEYAAASEAVAKLRARAGSAQAEYVKLGGTFRRGTAQAQGFFEKLRAGVDATNPALNGFADSLGKLGAVLTGPIGAITAMVVGVGALATATALATKRLVEFAVASANARRSELLRLEGMVRMRTVLGIGLGLQRDNAAALQESIDRVAASTATGRDALIGYATGLERAGLRGKNLTSALEGLAIVSATQSEEQVAYWKRWYQIQALSGASVAKITARIKRELGGIAKKQLLDLNVQAVHFHENLKHLFDGVNIDPFLTGVRRIVDMFGKTALVGKTLRDLFTRLAPTITKVGDYGVKYLTKWIYIAVKAALKLENVFLRMQLGWRNASPFRTFAASALRATGNGALADAVAPPPPKPKQAVFVAPAKPQATIDRARRNYDLNRTALSTARAGAATIGLQIGAGVIGGIGAMEGPMRKATAAIAAAAQREFKTQLQIKSPSKVFAALGEQIPLGIARGILQREDVVHRAMAALIALPAKVPMLGAAAASAGPAVAGGGVTIETINVYAGAGADAGSLARDFKRELERALTDVASQLGVAPA